MGHKEPFQARTLSARVRRQHYKPPKPHAPSPRAVGAAFTVISTRHFFSRRFDQAVPKLLLATQEGYPSTYRVLAACYAHFLGRFDEARGIIKRLRRRPCSGARPQRSPQLRATRAVSLACAWRWANPHNDRLNGGNLSPLRRVPGIRTRRSR
jgi:hypothetical protein